MSSCRASLFPQAPTLVDQASLGPNFASKHQFEPHFCCDPYPSLLGSSAVSELLTLILSYSEGLNSPNVEQLDQFGYIHSILLKKF